jgi:co-chaperonin GroES (HSP10)
MSEKVKWIKIDESDKSTWPKNNDMVLLKLRNGRMLDASVNRYQDQFGDNIYFNDWYGDDVELYEVEKYIFIKDIE